MFTSPLPTVVAAASLGAAIALSAPVSGAAQASGEAATTTEPVTPGSYRHDLAPVAQATRAQSAIAIDGSLSDDAWAGAEVISDFRQVLPLEGQPASERTEVRIVYDGDAVYVGALLLDSRPVTTRLARRDAGLNDSDSFVLLLDSYHDHETAYRFWTNPSGVKGDAILASNAGGFGRQRGDASWDPVWDLATRVVDEGWVVEMRIPFSQLRYSRDEQQVWGFQVERNINRNQEEATFPFTPLLERSGVSRYAHLHGIAGIQSGRRLELLPYVVARGEYLQLDQPSGVAFGNPYRSGSDFFGGTGLDLKYRIASNVTLDATVNPDFGQVELDPSVINLTAFETRFDERRPFFVEGADIFEFGEGGPAGSTGRPPQMLYSRRIGRTPRGSTPADAVFSDIPTATTILGAAKVTGRFGGGWSLGVLEALTAGESAAYIDDTQQRGEVGIEPRSNHLVARLRRQLRGGATRFGAIGTLVNRDAQVADISSSLHSSAYAGGIDFAFETTDREWMFSGLFSGSRIQGDAEGITNTQRRSARYFQRPDASHLEVDPLATSLSGFYAMGFVGKQAGTFTMRNGFAYVSPGFEVNDLGFQTQADRVILDTHYQFNRVNPGPLFRSWNLGVSPDFAWNTSGSRIFANINANLNFELLNYWRMSLRHEYEPGNEDDRLTRGGPMARQPGGGLWRVSLNSDGRRAATGRGTFTWTHDDAGGWSRRAQLNVNARVQETVQLSVGPSLSWSRSAAQYVTRIEDALATTTFGSRYVFADLEQTTLSLESRVNVTFSPALSLQLYVEPFISVGDFGTLKQFRAPGTFEFLEYGSELGTVTRDQTGAYDVDPDGIGPAQPFQVSDRDFSFRSLLGNAVLRWEWRPGSTLFLVWQQRRVNRQTGHGDTGEFPWVGTFDFGRDAGDMLDVAPDNIFMVKLNYWLNP